MWVRAAGATRCVHANNCFEVLRFLIQEHKLDADTVHHLELNRCDDL